jgi:hypothetical protein
VRQGCVRGASGVRQRFKKFWPFVAGFSYLWLFVVRFGTLWHILAPTPPASPYIRRKSLKTIQQFVATVLCLKPMNSKGIIGE